MTGAPVPSATTIPARVHFCWIGKTLPWAYSFAILSAAARSGLPEILLHHTDDLDDSPQLRLLGTARSVRLCRIDPAVYLRAVGSELGLGDDLSSLYASLTSTVKRCDILRAAILYKQGGIYLDLDTVTVASLVPLLRLRQCLGTEFVVWPQSVRSSHSPLRIARSLGLDLIRKALRRMPGGWALFRHVEWGYFRGINNAVMAAGPGAQLFADYLRAMTMLTLGQQAGAYAFGPHLLQKIVGQYKGDDLTIHLPRVFYPLAPEISEHWFRFSRAPSLAKVLSAETLVVHWYASVRTKSRIAQINPGYIRAHRKHQLYSMLVDACIPSLLQPA